MVLVIHSFNLCLKAFILGSTRRSGGSLLYNLTEDQHQLLFVSSSSQFDVDALQVTPAATNAASEDAACLVLSWPVPEVIF